MTERSRATFILRRQMHRRTFLRGAGAALALPWLEAMAPPLTATARAAGRNAAQAFRETGTPPKRLGFVYIPHGVIMNQWTPAAAGASFELTPILKPLEPYRDDLIVVSNLTRAAAVDNHACSASAWLTGVAAKRTDGPDFFNGVSVDQVIARQIGQDTLFPSLELATEDFTGLVGACDPGYSCAYINTLNWQTPTTPLPMEINPRVTFDRLFGSGRTAGDRADRRQTDRSLLDFVAADLQQIERGLGAADKARLGEYLGYVREIERRIQRAEERAHDTPDVPNAPVGVPESYEEHVGLMFDLLALAYQTDLTRVFTFMMAREVSQRTYPQIGITEPHHSISHHGNRPAAITGHARLNTHHVDLFGKFIERLKTTREGDGSLLDHSLIVYGSGMSDGNGHTGAPLPHLVLGKAGGRVKGNRHLVAPEGTPMANLLLTLAQINGVEGDRWGVSRGTLEL